MKRCPYCAEEIQDAAIVCRFCQRSLVDSRSTQTVVAPTSTRVSKLRVLAKSCHLLVLGWTVFCVVGTLRGASTVSDQVTADQSGFAAIGAGIGLAVWAVVWFVPTVGLELIAIASSLAARGHGSEQTGRREWRLGATCRTSTDLVITLK